MNKVKSTVVIIVICLLSLCLGVVFVASANNVAYADTSADNTFNAEYDEIHADIMDRYEQNLITYDEAESEYFTLSESGVTVQTESKQISGGVMPFANTNTVSGNVSWIPESGAAVTPLRRVKVVLYNGIPGLGFAEIATTFSDYDGNYSFTYNIPIFGDYQNLSIAVYTESETFIIARDWTAIIPALEYYVLARFDTNVNLGDSLNLIYSYETNDRHEAFAISQSLAWAQRYAMEVGGMSTDKLMKVAHPSDETSFCWSTFSAISNTTLSTSLHEYGHFVTGAMGNLSIDLFDVIFNANDFSHDGEEDHFVGKNKSFALDLAWMESWASAFALMAYQQYSGIYGANQGMANNTTDHKTFDEHYNHYNDSGEAQERAVISLLWDLFGERNVNLTDDVWTPLGHSAFWQRTMSLGIDQLMDFTNGMSNSYPQYRDQIGTRLSFFKIAPQDLEIANTPKQFTPPTFTWRVNGSQSNPNNQFKIGFYDESGVQLYETGNLSFATTAASAPNAGRADLRTATATIPQNEWATALGHFPSGSTMNISVKGYLNSAPVSGSYWSGYTTILSPAQFTVYPVPGGVTIMNVIGTLVGSVEIPETFNGQPVVAINDFAFDTQTQLTQIVIPSSVTSIGEYAFAGCTSLQTVDLPSTITTIAPTAFDGCMSLTDIVYPNSFFYSGQIFRTLDTGEYYMIIEDKFYNVGFNNPDDEPYYPITRAQLNTLPKGNSLETGQNVFDISDGYVFISFSIEKYAYYEVSFPYDQETLEYGISNLAAVRNFDLSSPIQVPVAVSTEMLLEQGDVYLIVIIFNNGYFGNTLTVNLADKKYVYFNGDVNGEYTMAITDGVPVELPKPEIAGVEFLGWQYDGEFVDEAWLRAYPFPDVELDPAYNYIPYTITYKETDGTVLGYDTYDIASSAFDLLVPAKPDKVFVGWYEDVTFSGDAVWDWGSNSQIGDKTLYAKWTDAEHTVFLDVNSAFTDGTPAYLNSNNVTVAYGEGYMLPVPVPHSADFVFVGWFLAGTEQKYTDADGISISEYLDEEDITLVAKWRREQIYIQIEFDSASGYYFRWLARDVNGNPVLEDTETPIEVELGMCPNCWVEENKHVIYKEGHIFDSLRTENGEIACWHSIPQDTIENQVIQLYYRYEKEQHAIRFNQYNENELPDISLEYGESLAMLSSYAPPRIGYTFSRWTVSNISHNHDIQSGYPLGSRFSFTTMPDFTINSEGDGEIYLTAVFNPVRVLVTFDAVYDVSVNNVYVSYGSKPKLAGNLSTPGRTFLGWKYNDELVTDAAGNLKVATWAILPKSGETSVELVAEWDSTHTITFNSNTGNSVYPTTKDVTYLTLVGDLPYVTHSEGREFLGWFTSNNGGTQVTPSTTYTFTTDIYLYAQWKRIIKFISIDPNNGGVLNEYVRQSAIGETIYVPTPSAPAGYRFSGWGDGRYTSDYTAQGDATLYAEWSLIYYVIKSSAYLYEMPSIFGYTTYLQTIKNVRVSYFEICKLTAPDISGYNFMYWVGHGSSKTISVIGLGDRNDDLVYVDAYYEKAPEPSCVTPGTLITLSDGTQQAVETLDGTEELLVWNLFTGAYDTAPILFIDSDEESEYEIINLHFSDGTTVEVITEHGFYDLTLNKYVMLRADAAQYIGHWYKGENGDVQLVDVELETRLTTAWSPVTYGHLCYFVNGMLSMPGATTGLINIFEVDPDAMMYDADLMDADIEEYGLFTYDEFYEIFPIPEEIFNAFNGQYLKVSIGKGLITYEELGDLITSYAEFFV